MKQPSKRPGARDISDLKARLGLHKNANSKTPPDRSRRNSVGATNGSGIPAPPGLIPPPGAAAQSGIIAPPGIDISSGGPPAAGDHVPRATAVSTLSTEMGASAGGATLSDENPGIAIAKKAAPYLGVLCAGVLIGKVGQTANQHNQVITDAAPIMNDVKAVRRGLSELAAALESGKKNGKFIPGDPILNSSLSALPQLEGDAEQLYKSSLYHLDHKAVASIYGFYSDIDRLNWLLKVHLRATKSEATLMKRGALALTEFSASRFGGVVTLPSGDEDTEKNPPTFQLVRLAGPICAGKKRHNPDGCGTKPVVGMSYLDDGTETIKAQMFPRSGETPEKQVIILNPTTQTAMQFVKGGEVTATEAAYLSRIELIESLATSMLESGKTISKALNGKTNENPKFSFFL